MESQAEVSPKSIGRCCLAMTADAWAWRRYWLGKSLRAIGLKAEARGQEPTGITEATRVGSIFYGILVTLTAVVSERMG